MLKRYELKKSLGKGGQGEVFLMWDRILGRKVAVKVIQNAGDAFYREADFMKQLPGHVFPEIYDAFIEEGIGYLVEEYIRGELLNAYAQKHPFSEKEIADFGKRMGEILRLFHEGECKIILRDLKPDNILIEQNGNIRFVDAGAVSLCQSAYHKEAARVGTFGYAAPEQWAGEPIDCRADLYSLGAILADLIWEQKGGAAGAFLKDIPSGKYIPSAILRILKKLIAQNAEERYSSAADFLHSLSQYKKMTYRYMFMEGSLWAFGYLMLLFILWEIYFVKPDIPLLILLCVGYVLLKIASGFRKGKKRIVKYSLWLYKG